MLLTLMMASALAQSAPACTDVRFSDIVETPGPAVIVLGERHGFGRDQRRAIRVARRLSLRAPVTLALEAVDGGYQHVLDAYAAGEVEVDDLASKLHWEETWGFALGPYLPLITAADDGVDVVAAGLALGPKPEDAHIPLPPRYIDLLRPYMGGHDIPLGMESDFVASMAWRDHELARQAVEGWSGEGYLVLVVGRTHVEGSKGVAWQAARLTDKPVHAFVLVKGKDAPCHPGDMLWP